MEIKFLVAETLCEISGIDAKDLIGNDSIHLIKDGIIDSLSGVTMLSELSERIGIEFSIMDFQLEEFSCVESIAAAIEKIIYRKKAGINDFR